MTMCSRTFMAITGLLGAALLAACGGGSDSSEEARDSSDCFNTGFYRQDTQINVTQSSRLNDAPAVESRFLHWVTSQKEENGINTIYVSPDTGRASIHYSIEGGALLYHGYNAFNIGATSRQSLTPAQQSVIAMTPGQTTSQTIVQTDSRSTADQEIKTVTTLAYTRTYEGREAISTALGQFEACRFLTTIAASPEGNPDANSNAQTTSWVASAGTYRGLTLKERTITRQAGKTDTLVTEASRVNQFDIR
ncbi:hypothetical protein [Comamonas odontotermitis]|uniref:hypothetical protein n=1 Tax=Comamonas odontotermitis TaxID=379895 RepID=UPI001CC41065|nr:hypothetical protein [Comamonas odontotermitis]UBB16379.1 hypothetical protein LAD35_16410 [Comamonas odontotermitis]